MQTIQRALSINGVAEFSKQAAYSSLNVQITIQRQREICFPPRLDGTGTPALWYTGTLALAHCHCGTRQSLCAQFAFDGLPFVDGYQCFFNGHYL